MEEGVTFTGRAKNIAATSISSGDVAASLIQGMAEGWLYDLPIDIYERTQPRVQLLRSTTRRDFRSRPANLRAQPAPD